MVLLSALLGEVGFMAIIEADRKNYSLENVNFSITYFPSTTKTISPFSFLASEMASTSFSVPRICSS